MPTMVARMAHHLHCIMHSAVIAGTITVLVWTVHRSLWIPLLAWWSHIVIDVFTHSDDHYPSPVLYPITYWGFGDEIGQFVKAQGLSFGWRFRFSSARKSLQNLRSAAKRTFAPFRLRSQLGTQEMSDGIDGFAWIATVDLRIKGRTHRSSRADITSVLLLNHDVHHDSLICRWAVLDSNQRPRDYESPALTN